MKIDKRKTYFAVVDIETANSLADPLAYDFGILIGDKQGNIMEKHSYIISDVFHREKALMKSAYYAEKLPKYHTMLENGEMEIIGIVDAKFIIQRLCNKYNIKIIYAYNASFDRLGLSTSIRYITKSKFRWFFPYGVEINCIWAYACNTILKHRTFLKLAIEKGWISPKGNIKTSAEYAYRYISENHDFIESHTGLADCEIEYKILLECFKQKKGNFGKIDRLCWRIPTKFYKENVAVV